MGDLPDLLIGDGVSCGPHGCIRLITVEATNRRGEAFLCAYYEATDKKAGGSFYDEEPEFLTFLPEE
jgi:hypothetical protein